MNDPKLKHNPEDICRVCGECAEPGTLTEDETCPDCAGEFADDWELSQMQDDYNFFNNEDI